VVVAVVAGLAIIAATFFLSWATEALETVLAQPVALALLALIEVAPEYTFEVILAYRRQTELASASMTGANRLLLGLGWPMIFFVAFWSSRRKGQAFTEIRLDWRNTPEILFLLVATLYAFVIVLKHTFSLIDSAILILIIAWLYLALAAGFLFIVCLYVDELKGKKNICCVYSPHPKFCTAPGYFALSIGDQSKGAHVWEVPLCAANTDVIDVEIDLFSTGYHRNAIGLFQPRLDG